MILPEAILHRLGTVSDRFCFRNGCCLMRLREQPAEVAEFAEQYVCNMADPFEDDDPEEDEGEEGGNFPDMLNSCFYFRHCSQRRKKNNNVVTTEIMKFVDDESDDLFYRVEVFEVASGVSQWERFFLGKCKAGTDGWEQMHHSKEIRIKHKNRGGNGGLSQLLAIN